MVNVKLKSIRTLLVFFVVVVYVVNGCRYLDMSLDFFALLHLPYL